MTGTRDAAPNGTPGTTGTAVAIGGGIAAELRAAVSDALAWLVAVPDAGSRRPPRPGGWSPREIIGHLIDSASNNHGRFVRAALEESLVFAPYDQEAWVALHRYREQEWTALLERWAAFNEQVAVAIEHIPDSALQRARREHNFDRIAWKTIAAGEPVTLEYFIRDYIGHLRHHLAQVAAIAGPRSR
jgi:hypothetical protein